MGIRKGVDDIVKKNKEAAKRFGQRSQLPELVLFNDGDTAIMRILTDDPVDVDMHVLRDKTSFRPTYVYCTLEDNGKCEFCELDEVPKLTQVFFFWVYVYRILHEKPDDEGEWEKTQMGNRTYYSEDKNSVMLLKRTHGFGNALWNQFEEAHNQHGTWKDRDYAFKRKGVAKDPQTTHILLGLDKEAMSADVAKFIGKLPPLEAVARGTVTRLAFDDAPAKESTAKSSYAKQPKVVREVPDIEE